jgi:hypothetical protein
MGGGQEALSWLSSFLGARMFAILRFDFFCVFLTLTNDFV